MEFRLLQVDRAAKLGYQISMDRALHQQWAYLLTALIAQDGQMAVSAINESYRSQSEAVHRLLGEYRPVDARAEQAAAASTVEKQQAYLEALGDKPFTSLNAILGKVQEVSAKLAESVNPSKK